MEKSNKEVALEVLHKNDFGVLGTNSEGKPNSRFMTFQYEGDKLYTIAKKDSTVASDITGEPNVHIVIGYEGDSLLDTFLEIEGKAILTVRDDVKQQLVSKYPNVSTDGLTVIEITPSNMRIMNKKGKNREDVEGL